MEIDSKQQALLRELPGVDRILEAAGKDPGFGEYPKSVRLGSTRKVLESLRKVILYDSAGITPADLELEKIISAVAADAAAKMAPNLQRTINATGIVVHTNLGRSLLNEAAVENIRLVSTGYSNLEFDLSRGVRGSRYSAVEDLLCELTGAESALAVNNNAGAVLLCLDTAAHGREVIVSRGELVEIGGAFRIPDVMSKSGGILREVGTTNRTHLKDYEKAICDQTGLLLKVHQSNYAIVGFTAGVSLPDMVALGRHHNLPVMEDLGSGTLIDFSRYGLPAEPTVQESVQAGVDLVTFSGDKLLGGPQAGIIVGRKTMIDDIKANPLTRALRIDKLTLAALESTLRLYRDEKSAVATIPTLNLLTTPRAVIERRAARLADRLSANAPTDLEIRTLNRSSKAGGGSLPLLELPSVCIGLSTPQISASAIEKSMRANTPPVIGRIEDDAFLMDLRTVRDDEVDIIGRAFDHLFKEGFYMTNPLKNLFNDRSASNDFLLSKTEAVSEPEKDAPAAQPLLFEALTAPFPELLAGPAFIEQALARLAAAEAFQVLVIRTDPAEEDPAKPETETTELQVALAGVLDHFCENQSWQWGKVDRDLFGCFLPLAVTSEMDSRSAALKKELEALEPATFSIGGAAFPLLNYNREEILDNARKALDHAAFFGPASVVDFDAVSLNISGDRFYQKGDVNQAMAEFNRALELDPENVNVHNSLGVCYGILGAYEKAAKIFKSAARLAPAEIMPIYNTGLADFMIGDKEKALESFLAAGEKDPEVFEPAFQVGRVYIDSGKPKKARPFLEKAITLKPDNAPAHRYLGLCWLALKKYEAAIVAFKKAVQLNPNDPHALSALGYLFDRMGENPEITTIFCQQSVEIAPENSLFRYRLGQLLVKKGLLEEALKEFETAQQQGHDVGKLIETVKDRIAIEMN